MGPVRYPVYLERSSLPAPAPPTYAAYGVPSDEYVCSLMVRGADHEHICRWLCTGATYDRTTLLLLTLVRSLNSCRQPESVMDACIYLVSRVNALKDLPRTPPLRIR